MSCRASGTSLITVYVRESPMSNITLFDYRYIIVCYLKKLISTLHFIRLRFIRKINPKCHINTSNLNLSQTDRKPRAPPSSAKTTDLYLPIIDCSSVAPQLTLTFSLPPVCNYLNAHSASARDSASNSLPRNPIARICA